MQSIYHGIIKRYYKWYYKKTVQGSVKLKQSVVTPRAARALLLWGGAEMREKGISS